MQGLMSGPAVRRDARAKAATVAQLWERPYQIEARKAEVQDACLVSGVAYPVSRWGVFPEMLRTQAPEWWGRQIKKADRREAETLALKAGRVTHYCSDLIFSARQQQRKETREYLERLVAVCETEDGERIERELLELAKGSNSNPAVRRAELMTRVRGFEEYAKRKKHVAYFLTFTCPSRFHRNSGDRWNGATPREAQQYLCKTWAKARAALARHEFDLYGFRIAEPHKDGCPHWHCLFWFESHHIARRACAIMRRYFLADTPGEPGAKLRRVTVEAINPAKGSATGYVAKYICKNVDGLYDDQGEAMGFDDMRRDTETGELEKTGLSSADGALRVDAWAGCWGVRQFQQIGGPNVGPYREFRRMGKGEAGAAVLDGAPAIAEQLRQAADAGQWDLFAELDDDHKTTYGARVKVWANTSADKLRALPSLDDADAVRACLNAWQEPTLREVKGVAVAALRFKSRFLKWVVMLKQALGTKSKQLQARDFIAAFQEKVRAGKSLAFDWFEGLGAAPPGPLEFCQ